MVNKRVGIVATGDELTHGDILNTNGQYISKKLLDKDIIPGQQIIVRDNTAEISEAISYLKKNHNAIITIGGLGPTSDDKTRFALADALQTQLEFNAQAWQWIVDVFTKKERQITENNRQQALLPKNSTAIFNANGTACACYLQHKNYDFFMLPGPPNECLEIFDNVVINKLITLNYSEQNYRKSWILNEVSESAIANELEPLMQNFADCHLGYRVFKPYLEIKLHSQNKVNLEKLAIQFTDIFGDKLIKKMD